MIWRIPKSRGGIMNRNTFPLMVYILFPIAILTACNKPTETSIKPTDTLEPTTQPPLVSSAVAKTLEPSISFAPILQSFEMITSKNAHDVKQLEYWDNSFDAGGGPVAFSPQGDSIAVGNYERHIELYNLATGKLLVELQTQIGYINSIAFSPDGKLIAAGGGIYPDRRGVQIWDVATQQLLLELDDFDEAVRSLAFSPNGAILATADGHPWSGGGSAKIWDVKSGALLAELTVQGKIDQLYIQAFSDIAFNPDGTLLAAINADGKVQFWDVISHKEVGMITGVGGEGSGIAFSPDGKLLAASGSAAGNTNMIPDLRLWDVATGEQLFRLEGHKDMVNRVAFSPNGQVLASSSYDGTMRLWNVETGEALAVIEVEIITSIAFRPDGTLLATGGDIVRLWGVPSP